MDPVAALLFFFLFLFFLGEILFLITPVDLQFAIKRFSERTEFFALTSFGILTLNVHMAGGSTRADIRMYGHRLCSFSTKETVRGDTGGKIREREAGSRVPVSVFRHFPGLIRDGMHLFRIVAHEFSFRGLDADIRLGLPSPSQTGIFFGYFSALKAIVSPIEKLRLTLTPVFSGEVMEGRISLRLRVRYPVRILVAVFCFLSGRNMRRLVLDIVKEGAS